MSPPSKSPVATSAPRLSVIVPATNDPPTLDRCTAAIRPQLGPDDELIVVTEAAMPGPAAARNQGGASATGDVLVFVDADVVIRPGAMDRVRAGMGDADGPHALFGSYDDTPEAPGAVSGFRNLLHHHVHQSSPGRATTFWAGLGAVRRDAFERSEGFDERAYAEPSIEDVELGMRMTAAGDRIVLDPDLQGTHLKRWTIGDMLRTDVLRRGAPWVSLVATADANGRRPGGSSDARALNLDWPHRLSALATLGLLGSAVARRPRAAGFFTLALLVLNWSFYALLLRRRGPREAASGIALHALHHLSAVVSVPLGLARGRSGARRRR